MIIGIVDDNQNDQLHLQNILQTYLKEKKIDIDIVCFDNGQDFLNNYIKHQYILVFMDIYMDDLNGIDVVKNIRENDPDLLVVFLTTSKEHIFEAASLHIFDYIQKPYQQDRIYHILKELEKYIPHFHNSIEFDCGKQHVCLLLSDIMYIYANNNFTVFKMKEHEEKYRIPFSKIIDMINDERFIFCIRGIMINIDYILKQEKDYFVMNDNKKVYIRRNAKKDIIKTYENYLFQKLENL